MTQHTKRLATGLIGAAILTLSACGGGSSSSGGDTTTPSVLQVSGVAATGAALSGATVNAKCATGTQTGTTLTDGSYTLSITDGALPCVLEASDGTTTLHSLASGSGDSATANITPVTELVVAQLSGQDPATFFANATAGSTALPTTITSEAVTTAAQAVVQTLASAGLDTSALTDPITSPLAAGTGSGYDGVLDALATQLTAAGSSLSEVVATVASASPASTSTSATDADSGTSALAAELLLKPAASSCSSLRASDYWAVVSGATGGTAIKKFRVGIDTSNDNSVSITFYTSPDGSTLEASSLSLTATAPVNCRFAASDGSEAVVSPAGVIVVRTSTNEAVVAVPVQSHTFDDIAGSWNIVAGDTAEAMETGWTYGYATMSITGSGTSGIEQLTQGCWFGSNQSGTCTDIGDEAKSFLRPVTLRADGSFTNHSANNTTDGGPWEDRFFVYKNGKGDYFAISSNISTPSTSGDGSLGYASKVRTLKMPTVGSISSNWNLPFDWTTSLTSAAIDAVSHTISSVDATAGSFLRQTGTYGSTATHPETILLNSPYNGFNFRDFASGVAVSGGGTTAVRQGYFLKSGSNAVTVVLQPYQVTGAKPAKIVISVAHPAS